MAISLITKGILNSKKNIELIQKTILPLALQINEKNILSTELKSKNNINVSLKNIKSNVTVDKKDLNVSLKNKSKLSFQIDIKE